MFVLNDITDKIISMKQIEEISHYKVNARGGYIRLQLAKAAPSCICAHPDLRAPAHAHTFVCKICPHEKKCNIIKETQA